MSSLGEVLPDNENTPPTFRNKPYFNFRQRFDIKKCINACFMPVLALKHPFPKLIIQNFISILVLFKPSYI